MRILKKLVTYIVGYRGVVQPQNVITDCENSVIRPVLGKTMLRGFQKGANNCLKVQI